MMQNFSQRIAGSEHLLGAPVAQQELGRSPCEGARHLNIGQACPAVASSTHRLLAASHLGSYPA